MAIHVGHDVYNGYKTKADTQCTFPMIIDYDSRLLDAYTRAGTGVVLFPLAYLIDKNGVIRHIYEDEEPALQDVLNQLQALLAE